MSLGRYLRSHLFALACDAAAIALLAVLLPALGVERDPTILVCLCVAVLLAAGGLFNFLRQRRFMRDLSRIADTSEGALEQAELLEEPGYPEGDLAAQALANVARDGRARAGAARTDMEDYRRYIETWVHEVKTPLAAMRLFLENHPDESLRPLRREVDRVDASVEQALYYARSSSVEKDFVVRPVALEALVRGAVRSRSHALIEAHMSVGADGLDDVPAVSCDAKWMGFVLGQLIDNAVRYRANPEHDGRSPRIEFSACLEEAGTARERVVLAVRDNGCGVSEADLPRVFDRGFTGSNGRDHEHSTGMGLYLVRTLCEKMGLAVDAESESDAPGRPGWTRISIAFPITLA